MGEVDIQLKEHLNFMDNYLINLINTGKFKLLSNMTRSGTMEAAELVLIYFRDPDIADDKQEDIQERSVERSVFRNRYL